MITELDNFTASITSFNETTGADISVLHPTVLVVLTPNTGYNIIAANFSAILPLPTGISDITFAQNGLDVDATITFISPFIMPQADVPLPFCINGFAELITYSISGSISDGVTCNIGAYPNAYSGAGVFGATVNVLTVPTVADLGYYFPTTPVLSLASGNINNYSLLSSKIFDIEGNLIEVDFTIVYTFPNANIAGDIWSLDACAYEIYVPVIEIASYSISTAGIIPAGDTRIMQVFGNPGATFTINMNGVDLVTNSVMGPSGVFALEIVFPEVAVNTTYTIELSGDLATPFIQQNPFTIEQRLDTEVAFNVLFNAGIGSVATVVKSFTAFKAPAAGDEAFTIDIPWNILPVPPLTGNTILVLSAQPTINEWSNINPLFNGGTTLYPTANITLENPATTGVITVSGSVEIYGGTNMETVLDLTSLLTIITTPQLNTTAVTNIQSTSASSGGNTLVDNGGFITAKGVEWSTDNFLSISGSTNDGTGTSDYASQVSPIASLTTHYVRAYATNEAGTDYGNVLQFDTPSILVLDSYTTTDPTNGSGTNGTATIYFTGNAGPFTYTVDGPPPVLTAVSPLQLTGLEASTAYIVEITDSTGNTLIVEFELGESSFQFYADWVMVTYEFIDGLDLDTRSRIVSPNIGQTTQPDMLGWSVSSAWPTTGIPIMTWGGDNTGTGFESVLMDINQFKAAYPTEDVIVGDFRCFWYNATGIQPVKAACTLWKGGTPVKNGFIWENPTATETLSIDSVSLVIPGPYAPGDPDGTSKSTTTGWRLATLTYDLATGLGVLNNADTTTPNV